MAGEKRDFFVRLGMCACLLLLFIGRIPTVTSMSEDCTVELYELFFNQSLVSTKTPWALVEFFQSWCESCEEFKPQYEQVACLFNHPNAVHGDEVFVAKVDCKLTSNKVLCERFQIEEFPTLYWGPPQKLAFGGGSINAKLGLESTTLENVNTGDKLLQWINRRIGKKYSLKDKIKTDIVAAAKLDTGSLVQVSATLHDVEEATARAFDFMIDEKMMKSSSRASFIQFLHLIDKRHPSERCRTGSAELLRDLNKLWPMRQSPSTALRSRHLCGPDLPRGYWVSCNGEGRGYRYNSFSPLPTVYAYNEDDAITPQFAVNVGFRVEDIDAEFARSTIEAFVADFYKCKECRDLFSQWTTRAYIDSASTHKDVVLWLWRMHNKVTEFVARDEAATGIMKVSNPRKLWPLESDCPACRDKSSDDTDWDETAVYHFLMWWYGPLLRVTDEETSQISKLFIGVGQGDKSSSVPYLTASGVAISGIGLATYHWRVHCKKLKLTQRRC